MVQEFERAQASKQRSQLLARSTQILHEAKRRRCLIAAQGDRLVRRNLRNSLVVRLVTENAAAALRVGALKVRLANPLDGWIAGGLGPAGNPGLRWVR